MGGTLLAPVGLVATENSAVLDPQTPKLLMCYVTYVCDYVICLLKRV